jgi:hypothetical protein
VPLESLQFIGYLEYVSTYLISLPGRLGSVQVNVNACYERPGMLYRLDKVQELQPYRYTVPPRIGRILGEGGGGAGFPAGLASPKWKSAFSPW